MNIHLPAILMFTRGTRFWHTAIWHLWIVRKMLQSITRLALGLHHQSSFIHQHCILFAAVTPLQSAAWTSQIWRISLQPPGPSFRWFFGGKPRRKRHWSRCHLHYGSLLWTSAMSPQFLGCNNHWRFKHQTCASKVWANLGSLSTSTNACLAWFTLVNDWIQDMPLHKSFSFQFSGVPRGLRLFKQMRLFFFCRRHPCRDPKDN